MLSAENNGAELAKRLLLDRALPADLPGSISRQPSAQDSRAFDLDVRQHCSCTPNEVIEQSDCCTCSGRLTALKAGAQHVPLPQLLEDELTSPKRIVSAC
jgi:hypothetical protein